MKCLNSEAFGLNIHETWIVHKLGHFCVELSDKTDNTLLMFRSWFSFGEIPLFQTPQLN